MSLMLQKERKILENVRLDLDAAKGKVRKARSAEASKAVSTCLLIPIEIYHRLGARRALNRRLSSGKR